MGHCSGFSRRKIKSFRRADFIKECARAAEDGYELHKRSSKTDWPWFWRTKFKAEYRRYYIIDEANIAFIPKSQLDYIETGKIK